MNFGQVFSKAWKTIWQHKILWVFGIFAGLLSGGSYGSGSGYNFNSSDMPMMHNWPNNWPQGMQQFGQAMENFFNRGDGSWVGLVILLSCLALFFTVLSIFLGITGQNALIRAAWKVEEGSSEKMRFGELFKEGLRYFWKVFGLYVLVIIASVAAALAIIFISIITLGVGAILFICLALPLAIGAGLLINQSVIIMVSEDLGVFDGIKAAWEFVFEKNLGNYLLMFLILGIGAAILNFLIVLPWVVMLIPLGAGLFIGGSQAIGTSAIVISIVLGVLYLPLYLVLSGALNAYVFSAWTIFYHDLRGAKTEADLSPLELQESIPDAGGVE